MLIILTNLYNDFKNLLSLDFFVLLSFCSIVLFVIILILLVKYYRNYNNINYYLNIARTTSIALAQNNEIISFNETGEIVYTTHPNSYSNKSEFINNLNKRIAINIDFKEFCQSLDSGGEYQAVLTSKDIRKYKKRLMTSIHTVDEKHSFIKAPLTTVIITDITQYYSQTDELIRGYRKLETFIDNLPLGIFYIDNKGQILGCNITFASYLKVSKDKVIGSSIHDFIDNFEMSKIYNEPLKVTLKARYFTGIQVFLIKPPLVSFTSLQPLIVLKTSEVIKEIKEEQSNDNNIAFIHSAIPSIMVTSDGSIESKNKAFVNLINNDKLLRIRHNILDFVRDNIEGKSNRKDLKSSLTNSQNKPMELQLDCGDSHDKIVQTYIGHINLSNKSSNILVQFVDISSQKILEQQFLQSQKIQAVGQLASGIAHDFNNLLTAMIGFCDLLLQRYTPNDLSYGDVVQIKQNASRAANLVRQLLAFSRQQTLKPQIVSITDTLMDMSSLLKRLLGPNIDFRFNHGKDLWPVKVDNGQFEQVVMNLVVNARDAMHHKGNLVIQTRNYYADRDFQCFDDIAKSGDYVLLEVVDTGCGMDTNTMKHIFEPFFTRKITDIKKGTGSGTGLGLSTVYGIVKQTGGHIKVESEINKGTNFQIFIPRYTGSDTVTKTSNISQYQDLSGSETILLVEDEDAVRKFATRALRDRGYNVVEATNGVEALKIAENIKIDLLITDVIMPKVDGPTLNKRLREVKGNFKTIFISGYTEDTFRQDLDKDFGIHFMQKPFTLRDLANKVKEVLHNE